MELCNSQIIFYTFLKAKKKRGFLFNVSFIQNPSSGILAVHTFTKSPIFSSKSTIHQATVPSKILKVTVFDETAFYESISSTIV